MIPKGNHVKDLDIPVYPAKQLQLYELTPLIQTAPFLHGLAAQKSMTCWQNRPVKPAAHVHVKSKALGTRAQVAPFMHELSEHGSSSCWQLVPEKPLGHEQR